MIGFYDYTVILTYCGLLSSMIGIFQVLGGHFTSAIVCIGISLLCDTFDGKVARGKKNRTPEEALFGVQIDSLCDAISFGVFPSIFCYMLGAQGLGNFLFIGYYCLCCVIRLGYFNVLAARNDEEEKKIFHGLPVVCLAVFMPGAYAVQPMVSKGAYLWILRGLLGCMGTLYILDFKVKKGNLVQLAILAMIFLVPFGVILLR